MTARAQVYKCIKCGNIVEVYHKGAGALVCCGDRMVLLEENTTDAAQEKHVPVVEKQGDGIVVKVGEVAHPMADDHYIEWIEVISGGKVYTEFLAPGGAPEASFPLSDYEVVRAYCNVHGHWKA